MPHDETYLSSDLAIMAMNNNLEGKRIEAALAILAMNSPSRELHEAAEKFLRLQMATSAQP